MKVLLAHPSTELYGSDRQFAQSVAGFADAGWDLTVVLPGPGALADHLGDQLAGVPVRVVDVPVLRKAQLRPSALLALLLATPAVLVRLVRLIRAVSPDVVYVNTVTLPFWVLAARLARRPVVVHVHEAEEMTSPALRRLLYAPLAAAQAVIANSATTARVVGAACPPTRSRLTTVPNGVPDAGARPDAQVVPGRLTLVSRLSPRKGVDVALEAVALLRASGRNVTMTVCGSAFTGYEDFRAQLHERADRADLAGSVTFTGFVDSVQPELARAEIVLAPSFGESFGNAAVEGMLARRPVVASNVQGLAEIVQDGVSGLLVPVGDAEALASAIARLLDDPALAASLAARGRSAALERFSVERYRADVVDVSRRTLEGPEAARSTGRARAVLLVALALVAVLVAGCSGSGSAASASAGASSPGNVIARSTSAAPATSSTPASTAPRLTAPVAAPQPGDISQKVSSQPVVTRPAVPLAAVATVQRGLTVRVTAHSTVAGKATLPGEVSGPAIRLTLRLTNATGSPIPLDTVVVNVTDARTIPLVPLSGPPTAPFHGRLPNGRSASATYVFTLAQGRHNPYTITVSASARSAVVQFVGATA